jgi:CRISPR/Cas system Type II protein with McrA/HNH and RuvC-like nuclease domain
MRGEKRQVISPVDGPYPARAARRVIRAARGRATRAGRKTRISFCDLSGRLVQHSAMVLSSIVKKNNKNISIVSSIRYEINIIKDYLLLPAITIIAISIADAG